MPISFLNDVVLKIVKEFFWGHDLYSDYIMYTLKVHKLKNEFDYKKHIISHILFSNNILLELNSLLLI